MQDRQRPLAMHGCRHEDNRPIHLNQVGIDGTAGRHILIKDEAKARRLFHGPPYILGEEVFVEYDFEGCEPDNLLDYPRYEDRPPKLDVSNAVRGPFKEAVKILRARQEGESL